MGRRHFAFGPNPRWAQCHLSEASCRVVAEDDPRSSRSQGMRRQVSCSHAREGLWEDTRPWTPSKRIYPKWEATSGGSTEDQLTTCSQRRHVRGPPPKQGVPTPARAVRRHYVETEHKAMAQEADCTSSSSASGRRHVRPPVCHVAGVAPQVVRADSAPCSRRHCSSGAEAVHEGRGFAGRLAQQRLPAGRRHMRPQDNLNGGVFNRAEESPAPCRNAENPREDSLFGPVLVSSRGEPGVAATPTRQGRRPISAGGSLLGATLRYDEQPSTPLPPKAPEDSLVGHRFRDGWQSSPAQVACCN
uniref:Uncharacterized protein n=1 Tax=Alexandrium catenella TaxID=2925 RepID=A0A7S1MNL1_ALECA